MSGRGVHKRIMTGRTRQLEQQSSGLSYGMPSWSVNVNIAKGGRVCRRSGCQHEPMLPRNRRSDYLPTHAEACQLPVAVL